MPAERPVVDRRLVEQDRADGAGGGADARGGDGVDRAFGEEGGERGVIVEADAGPFGREVGGERVERCEKG